METIQKRLIGKEDISWDLSGNNEQNNYVFGNDSVAVSKINASHIPLTAEARDFLSAGNVDNALKNVHKKLNEFSASDGLTEDVVVEFEANDTVEDIQQKINLQKKNLNGHTLTFVFPRFLEQILSETIVFKDFFNGAVIVTGGDENNLIPIYDQFDITSLFKIYRCQCEFIVEYFYFTHSHSKYAVLAESSTSVIFRNCVFSGTQKEDSLAVKLFASSGELVDCDFINESSDGVSSSASGRAIGEYFSYPASIPPEGAYLLNGQTITNCRQVYPKFWEWVTTAGIRNINNATYEAELTSAGVCGGFVVNSATGSVRLPSVTQGALWGADSSNIGQSLAAGLPNITGTFALLATGPTNNNPHAEYSGAFSGAGESGVRGDIDEKGGSAPIVSFNAQNSNDVYGNSDTVQPPAIRVSWCIQVFNAATALSEQESAQLASEIQTKAQIDLANVNSNIDYVVESWNDGAGGWYRKYRSGWVEQGGVVEVNSNSKAFSVTLFVEYSNTQYNVLPYVLLVDKTGDQRGLSSVSAHDCKVNGFSMTVWGESDTIATVGWEAKGYAATE